MEGWTEPSGLWTQKAGKQMSAQCHTMSPWFLSSLEFNTLKRKIAQETFLGAFLIPFIFPSQLLVTLDVGGCFQNPAPLSPCPTVA